MSAPLLLQGVRVLTLGQIDALPWGTALLADLGAQDPEVGTLKYPGPGFFFDGANLMQSTRGAPRLGEHNVQIYCGRLGLSNEELGRLRAARVV